MSPEMPLHLIVLEETFPTNRASLTLGGGTFRVFQMSVKSRGAREFLPALLATVRAIGVQIVMSAEHKSVIESLVANMALI